MLCDGAIARLSFVVAVAAAVFTAGQMYTAWLTYKLQTKPVLFLSCRHDNIGSPSPEERRHVVGLGVTSNAPGFRFLDFSNPVVGPSGKYVRLPFVVARCSVSNQGQTPFLSASMRFGVKSDTAAPFDNTVQVVFGGLLPGTSFQFLVANLSMSQQWLRSPATATVTTVANEGETHIPLFRDDGATTLDAVTLPSPVSCYESGAGAFYLPGTLHSVIGRLDCARYDGVDAGRVDKTFSK